MLLGVEAAAGRGLALDAARRPAGAEPGLTRLRAEMIVGVELRDRLRKSRRHGDAARIRLLGLFRVVIGRVLVADRAREHHDVRGFDREGYLRQGAPPRCDRPPAAVARLAA